MLKKMMSFQLIISIYIYDRPQGSVRKNVHSGPLFHHGKGAAYVHTMSKQWINTNIRKLKTSIWKQNLTTYCDMSLSGYIKQNTVSFELKEAKAQVVRAGQHARHLVNFVDLCIPGRYICWSKRFRSVYHDVRCIIQWWPNFLGWDARKAQV
jgi:hypothetical protein